jgi:GNAT-like C-terminal domain/N-acyltransferase N-terminal domain
MRPPTMDAAGAAERLGLPAEQAAWVRGLDRAGPVRELRLPPPAQAPEVLRRLAVAPEDAGEILEGWPTERWSAELLWLLERVVAGVRADMGGARWLEPGPSLPRDRGPAWKHFYVYAYLALLESALAYHRAHGVPEPVSWATLGDLGRSLSVDRRMQGEGWPLLLQWLTLHVRGGIYELGRLQFQRGQRLEPAGDDAPGEGDLALGLHIPESGPLTPERCDESFRLAREFFPRHFPDEPCRAVICHSWLLDPQLAEYLPPRSNIVGFQRRFQLLPGGREDDGAVLRFVFHTLTTPLDKLPQRTTLERVTVAHMRAGGHWWVRTGWLALS